MPSTAAVNAAKILAAKREAESRPRRTKRQREAWEKFYTRRNAICRTVGFEQANMIAASEIATQYSDPNAAARGASESTTASHQPARNRERRDAGSDSDSDGPEPASRRRTPVHIEGTPSVESDAAVARFFEAFLAAERPGTTWIATMDRAA